MSGLDKSDSNISSQRLTDALVPELDNTAVSDGDVILDS
jgi:hypothetical protein